MSPAIKDFMEKIDNRILRERVLIFITSLAVVFLLWNFLVQARFDKERATLENQQKQVSTEQKELDAKIMSLTMAMVGDPAIIKKNSIAKLQTDIADVESRLAGLSQGLVSADQLPKILEDVLQRTVSVRLLQVRTLAATEVQLSAAAPAVSEGNNNAAEKVATGGTGVYKHGVLIRVAGSYAQLIQLMTEIEALQWKFYWESLDYSVKQYPNAEIDIRVFTLSSEEGLLGV
jgi:MSHA biogenesis protein MshJ